MRNLVELIALLIEAKLDAGVARIPLDVALDMSKELVEGMGLRYVDPSTVTNNTPWESGVGIPVGSVRRMKADIGDIDIIATSPVSKTDVALVPGVSHVSGGAKQVNFTYDALGENRKVNVYVALDPETFGGQLLHSTGPHTYNIRLRRKAQLMGLKLSQNGLVCDDQLIAGKTEAEIQNALNVRMRGATER